MGHTESKVKTPREKYMNDPEYHQLVCMLESFVERGHYTPSEMREAVVLACINYERTIDPRVSEAFRVLDEFTTRRPR